MRNFKRLSRLTVIAAAAVALSGCQSVHGFFAKLRPHAAEVRPVETALVNADLEAGRHFLAEGRLVAAIHAFRAAQADPDALPAASNGLGVAYARLGRFDLADRYFRVALSLEPANDTYLANLLRMQRDHELARRQTEETRLMAQAQSQLQQELEKAMQAPRAGALQRVSRGEVHIAAATAAPTHRLAEVGSREKAAPKLESSKSDKREIAQIAASDHPVRVDRSKVVQFD